MINNFLTKIALLALNALTLRNGLIFSALCFLLAWFAWLGGYYRLPLAAVTAYEAVPRNTAFLLAFNGFEKAAEQLNTAPYSGLQSWQAAQKVNRELPLIAQVLAHSPYKEAAAKSPLLAAAQVSKANDFDYLYILETGAIDWDAVALAAAELRVLPHHYKGCNVYEFRWGNGEVFSFASFGQVCLAARESFLVEYGIDQLNSYPTSLVNDADFKQVQRKIPQTAALIMYAQLPQLAPISDLYLTRAAQPLFAQATAVGNWVAVAPTITKTGLELNGSLLPSNIFAKTLRANTAESNPNIGTILPDNTAAYAQFNVGDFAKFQAQITKKDGDAARYFMPFVGHHFAYILTEPANANFADSHILAWVVNDKVGLERELSHWCQALGKEDIMPYQNYKLYHLPKVDFAKALFGESWDILQKPYYCIIDNYVVFSNSAQSIEVLIDKYNTNQTLNADPTYLDFIAHSTTHTNAFFYIKPSRCFQLLKAFYSETDAAFVQNLFAQWRVFEQVSISAKADDKTLNIKSLWQPSGSVLPQIAAASASAKAGKASLNWKAELQTVARTAPFVLRNSSNGEAEILIQDIQNRLYKIDRSGNILWTRQLEAPLLSSVYQIDLYTNQALQYLFNTKNKIYCLDKDGKDAPNYPITLGSPATNGLYCIDYDGERNYYFYLACANGNLYGFLKSGKPISGWNPLAARGYFTKPLQRFAATGKDYVMAVTDKGTLYAYTRFGAPHFAPLVLSAPTNSAIGFDGLSDPIKISVIDTSGLLNVVTLDGHRTTAALRVGTGRNVRASIADIGGDLLKEYLIISGKQLAVYGYRKKVLTKWWGADFEEPLDDVFTVKLRNNSQHNIVLLSRTAKELHLLDEAGVRYPSFPIHATTRCTVSDFFGKGTDVLVGACDNTVYTYTIE
jgi:hypothetical protein